jgi:hypothetical protein
MLQLDSGFPENQPPPAVFKTILPKAEYLHELPGTKTNARVRPGSESVRGVSFWDNIGAPGKDRTLLDMMPGVSGSGYYSAPALPEEAPIMG